MRSLLALSIPALFVLPAHGQLATGAITDGNVVYAHTSFPTSSASTGGLSTFRVTGGGGTNHLYQNTWYWRLDTDPREYAFHDGAGQGARSSNYAGNRVVHAWADVDGRGFAATLELQAFSTGASSGMVVGKMRFTNNTAAPVNVNLFAYVDYDQCLAFNNTAAANPHGNKQSLTDTACPVQGEAFAPGADRYEVATFPAIRTRLLDTAADDLTSTGLPYGPGDYSGAWQWKDRTVGPGATFTAYCILAQDTVHSGCLGVAAASTSGTGKAGTHGVPAFDVGSLPFLGRSLDLRVRNGLSGTSPYLILGTATLNLPFPPIGTILVDPTGALLFFGAPFDATHASATRLTIPNDATLCGATLHVQDFHVDPGAAGNMAHTDRLTWVLGGVH